MDTKNEPWTPVEDAIVEALRDLPASRTQAEIIAAGGTFRTDAQVKR